MSLRITLLMAGLLATVAGAGQAQTVCIAPDDTSARYLEGVQGMASATGEIWEDTRAFIGIPYTPPSKVTHVTDEKICQRIAAAIASNVKGGSFTPSGRVRVIRIDTYLFYAWDPAIKIYNRPMTFHLSRNYEVVRRVLH